ncbi:MAG: bifunctional acetate--CoA ligase family protein/GNAT family N-acetyltransferase [Verrucomicrobiales bacterium]|nr:bifunctional acetate--CoA ligase family protein/GNAT family N-acetyltransferase [Verrucomicrobiales bacterium]
MRRRTHRVDPVEPAPARVPMANDLEAVFAPRSIAVIGATERPGSVGRSVLQNLAPFPGTVSAINPNRLTVLGRRCYPNLAALDERPDLAVVITPAPTVPGIIEECAAVGVRAALILSAGFKETGPAGAQLEARILEVARRTRLRVIGPNSFGVMVPSLKFNGTLAGAVARPGSVAFLSQSGALCSSVLDWSHRENVGFSGVVSIGSMLDVGWGDLIYHFGDDTHTRSIVLYMETVGDARSFLSAAREVALSKPVIVIKVGRTEAAAMAAASHTGALADSDEVLDAAFRRVGVLRVDTIAELFDMAEALAKQPRPGGPRLAIVTNAGGPGALAADMLASQGGVMAGISDETFQVLNQLLPAAWSRGNPIDVLGEATPEMYARTVEAVAADDRNDGVVAVLTPQPMTDVLGTAEALKRIVLPPHKPVLASWMGGASVEDAKRLLNEAGFPTPDYPDAAAASFCRMWRHGYHLKSLYETPSAVAEREGGDADRSKAAEVIERVRAADRTLLTEVESKELLAAYGIPVSATQIALSETEAVKIANRLGYPVVLKLYSHTLTHKTEVGGVQLNLRNPIAVREAWRSIESHVAERAHPDDFLGVTVQPMVVHNGHELILGSSLDMQFGPVLLFGTGGQWVDVFRDRALGLPPLTATLALRMMEETKVFAALRDARGRKAIDVAALQALLVRFSYLVVEHPQIAEIDINPLIVAAGTQVAVDARVVLHPPDLDLATLPRPAIRPYPNQYVTRRTLADGTPVVIRPIHPEDEPRMVEFHKTLSDRSVYNRYFVPLKLSERIAHDRLVRVCFSDYDREIPLVTEWRPSEGETPQIIGIGRLSKEHLRNEGEFALIISDAWQGRGLGRQLLELLIQVSRVEKLSRLFGHILVGNREMQHVCKKLGFSLHHQSGDSECVAELDLGGS